MVSRCFQHDRSTICIPIGVSADRVRLAQSTFKQKFPSSFSRFENGRSKCPAAVKRLQRGDNVELSGRKQHSNSGQTTERKRAGFIVSGNVNEFRALPRFFRPLASSSVFTELSTNLGRTRGETKFHFILSSTDRYVYRKAF